MKGLEALENLCNQCEFYQFEKGLRPKKCPHNKNCVFRNRIEKELKEYEQYKAIEEEIGIDLVTLFKASKNGVYVKETQYSRRSDYIDGASLGFGHNSFYFYDAKNRLWNMFFKDYGKTWALTKEELL